MTSGIILLEKIQELKARSNHKPPWQIFSPFLAKASHDKPGSERYCRYISTLFIKSVELWKKQLNGSICAIFPCPITIEFSLLDNYDKYNFNWILWDASHIGQAKLVDCNQNSRPCRYRCFPVMAMDTSVFRIYPWPPPRYHPHFDNVKLELKNDTSNETLCTVSTAFPLKIYIYMKFEI